jgi:hypothetical protein
MKRPIKAQMATPRKPSDQIRAFPRRAIALTFGKEMEEQAQDPPQFYVMDIDGKIVGPVPSEVLTNLAASWQIGPDSPIRQGDVAEWATFREVANALGIALPAANDWRANRNAAIAKEKSDKRWGCAIFLVIAWIAMMWMGIGFLFVPILMWGVLYYAFGKLFGAMTGLDVLGLPMWNDFRVKRIPGQGWDFLAIVLAIIIVFASYSWRFTSQ